MFCSVRAACGVAWLMLYLAVHSAQGQQYAFNQVLPKDGLAQSQVRCMAQDAQGYLWFGTLGGASRFRGLLFQNYALQEGLPDAQVSAMAVDPSGVLWMGSGGVLVRVEGRTLVPLALPSSNDGARIMGLVADSMGRVFIGTDGGGMFVSDGQGIKPLSGYPADTAAQVRAVLLLRDGGLLIGLRNGLVHWKDGASKRVDLGEATPVIISALAQARNGDWWVGTFGNGVYRIGKDGTRTEYDEESGLLQNNVRCLLVDDRDRLWVGTKLGLNVFDGGRPRVFTVHQGMPNDNIQCAFQDAEGNLWFGTDGAGVLKYLGDRFITYTTRDGLCSDLVMSITADAQGDLWVGTYDNGICRQDAMAMITTLDGLPNNTIWCGLLDRDGSLWFGTSDGLAHIRNGLIVRTPGADPLLGQRVFALYQDGSGALWCGTREGLCLLRPDGTAKMYASGPDGPGRSVRAIIPDPGRGLWLATDQGLYLFKDEAFRKYTTTEGLCDNSVLCLVRDGKGRIWSGTANGLSCFDGTAFRTLRAAADFGSNYIDLLINDDRGRIWAGTNNGLFLFDPDSVLANPDAIERIGLVDGLRSLEFNLNAAFKGRQGRLLFGSTGGLVLHDIDRHGASAPIAAPRIHITGVRSFLQPTDWKDQSEGVDGNGLPIGLHLGYRRHYLTFDYTAISLSKPERVTYRYRLNGYDPDWLPATDARFASYSNLPHGEYTFEVIASIAPGVWSQPASIAFLIDPPYWYRWWFFLVCAVLLAGVLFGIQRYRTVRRERLDRTRHLMLRSRMLQLEQQALNANMNRHFVFNALNSIQFHINRQDRATASKYLTSFAKLIRKNLDASENDTTTLAEELERLELYLNLEHMRFKDKFRYTIEIDPMVDRANVMLPAMMLQPYVENSIWHGILPMGRQGHVRISAAPAEEAGRVAVCIEDDGIGVDHSRRAKQEANGDHISRGIEITKGRADVLRRLGLADIRIHGPEQWHDPGTGAVLGTRVRIELPVTGPAKKTGEHLRTGRSPLTFEQP